MVRIDHFLERIDARLRELVEAVWVEGSIALGDFHPHASDIDLVVLTRRDLDPSERITVRGRPRIEITWLSRARAATLANCDGGVGAVVAATLYRHGITLRGPSPREVLADLDHPALARAVVANLEAYWVPWLERARHHPLERIIALHPERIFWSVSGVPRQYVTVADDRIVSKCAAIGIVRERFDPRWHRILDEALRVRRGGPPKYGSPFERRREMLAFVAHAIERTRCAHRFCPG